MDLQAYDAGLFGDGGGGNVDWWQDYLRAELARAHDHYQAQAEGLADRAAVIEECARACEATDREGWEWVRDSLWANVLKRGAANVRALLSRVA